MEDCQFYLCISATISVVGVCSIELCSEQHVVPNVVPKIVPKES